MQVRFGWGIDRIEREQISWNDAWDLLSEVIRDPYSHCCAAVSGFKFVPTPEDVRFYDDLDVQAMRNKGKNSPMPRPVKRPWVSDGPALDPNRVRSAESVKRRDRLNERLGLTP